MVYEVTDNARQLGLIDNLFLNRYSQVTDLKSKFCFEVYSNEIIQAVTANGETINADESTTVGYGVWRLTREQFASLLTAVMVSDSSSHLI